VGSVHPVKITVRPVKILKSWWGSVPSRACIFQSSSVTHNKVFRHYLMSNLNDTGRLTLREEGLDFRIVKVPKSRDFINDIHRHDQGKDVNRDCWKGDIDWFEQFLFQNFPCGLRYNRRRRGNRSPKCVRQKPTYKSSCLLGEEGDNPQDFRRVSHCALGSEFIPLTDDRISEPRHGVDVNVSQTSRW